MHVCLSISLPIVLSAFILSLIILNSSTHKPGQIKCALTVSNTHTFTRYTTQNFTTFTVKHRSTCYCPAIYLPQIQHTHILPCYLSTTNTTHTYIATTLPPKCFHHKTLSYIPSPTWPSAFIPKPKMYCTGIRKLYP